MTMRSVDEERAITLGHPSYLWRFGQDRRLELIQRYARLEGRRVLDVGCGLGMYVKRFRDFTPHAFGVDRDPQRAIEAGAALPNIAAAASEALPFPDDGFDLVLLHEVIEHVADDGQTVREAYRVARPGGRVVIFAPNRLYPFETHGVYWRGAYHFGNIPLVGYLPSFLRRRLAPHVRVYTVGDIRRLLRGLDARLIVHTQIYPGYDNIAARRPWLGKLLRRLTYFFEDTPLRVFGLSHFVVIEKVTLAFRVGFVV
jgi:SAM-dependent methyltransferase